MDFSDKVKRVFELTDAIGEALGSVSGRVSALEGRLEPLGGLYCFGSVPIRATGSKEVLRGDDAAVLLRLTAAAMAAVRPKLAGCFVVEDTRRKVTECFDLFEWSVASDGGLRFNCAHPDVTDSNMRWRFIRIGIKAMADGSVEVSSSKMIQLDLPTEGESSFSFSLGKLGLVDEVAGRIETAETEIADLKASVAAESAGWITYHRLAAGWDSSRTTYADMYANRQDIVYFPNVEAPKGVNFDRMFRGCSGLREVPRIKFSENLASMNHIFMDCTQLTEISGFELPVLPDGRQFTGTCMFYQCSGLKRIDGLNLASCSAMLSMFNGCTSLESLTNFTPPAGTVDMMSMFYQCYSLREIPPMDYSGVSGEWGMWSAFNECRSIETLGDINCGNAQSVCMIFSNCRSLRRVESVDFASASNKKQSNGTGWDLTKNAAKLEYLKVLNLGSQPENTEFDFLGSVSWGSGSEENRQSLVDSLLTYSFDRVAAGYSAVKIKLPAQTLARLTEEERAAITAKGYTLVS